MKLVRLIVLVMVLVCWAAIGFVFWIPLLARMIALFTFAVLQATLGNHRDADRAQQV